MEKALFLTKTYTETEEYREKEAAVIKEKIAPMFPEYEFVIADTADQADVMGIYRSMIGTQGCTWDMDYPNEENFKIDISARNLFLLRTEEGKIAATISVDQDPLVDALENWSHTEAPTGELARLAVEETYQNRGIARKMILSAMELLRIRGYAGARFLVSRTNEKALASYRKLSFEYRGDCELFGHDWYCYEKLF